MDDDSKALMRLARAFVAYRYEQEKAPLIEMRNVQIRKYATAIQASTARYEFKKQLISDLTERFNVERRTVEYVLDASSTAIHCSCKIF
jgi:hypothetical protein